MTSGHQRGFLLPSLEVRNDILIPRYYDPRLAASLAALAPTHHLMSLDDMVDSGVLEHTHGSYVPKIFYGTGPYPYIRTSDIANWELRASPKHGVSKAVFDEYHAEQNVRPGDILFVHEGTYLIGTAGLVTVFDGPMLYQHHLAKFRVAEGAPFNAYFLMAALGTKIVQRQIRSKQFSADIIDSVVGRLGEVVIPVPKNLAALKVASAAIETAVVERASIRERLTQIFRNLEEWLQSTGDAGQLAAVMEWEPDPANYEGKPPFLGYRGTFRAFMHPSNDVVDDVLIPKYYDPGLIARAGMFGKLCDVPTIGHLVESNVLALCTGDEIGRLTYGTGTIPFVRTSDFGSYELLVDAKQGVSEDVLDEWRERQDVEPGDILLVRDGTYLVGTSTMVFEEDLPLLFCGGIIKIRVVDKTAMPPSLLYALLNTPFVRAQLRSKQFTRDVIDTLGNRLSEVRLPLPRDMKTRTAIAARVAALAQERIRLRVAIENAIASTYP